MIRNCFWTLVLKYKWVITLIQSVSQALFILRAFKWKEGDAREPFYNRKKKKKNFNLNVNMFQGRMDLTIIRKM